MSHYTSEDFPLTVLCHFPNINVNHFNKCEQFQRRRLCEIYGRSGSALSILKE